MSALAGACLPFGQWDRLALRREANVADGTCWTLRLQQDQPGEVCQTAEARLFGATDKLDRVFDGFLSEEEYVQDPIVEMDAVFTAVLALPGPLITGLARLRTSETARVVVRDLRDNGREHPGVWAALAPWADGVQELDELVAAFIDACDHAGVEASAQLAELLAADAVQFEGETDYDNRSTWLRVLPDLAQSLLVAEL